MKTRGINSHKALLIFLMGLLFIVLFPSGSSGALTQETSEGDPEFFMGILILESQQQEILESIHKVKDLQLGNMIILQPMDQAWNPTLIEETIKEANDLGLFTIFETYNASDHLIKITPEQFAAWKSNYPHLLGILISEITGKQIDMKIWDDNSTGTITKRLQAEQAVIENITSTMKLPEFKDNGAKIFLQENAISYASTNTSYCDVFISKIFNAPNAELMMGLARGMVNSYNIPAWGLWVDTWRGERLPPAFTPNDVERALYEGWFYGAKYFFFEQGNFFGTLDRDWPNKYIILDSNGELTEYGRVIQRFYAFLQNGKSIGYNQPNYDSSIAVMIGQSGWGSRGSDWGLWSQDERQGDFDYNLLNLFFPGIGDNWFIGYALVAKEFAGLPFGMVDVISIYAPPSAMKQYDVIIGLGWSLMSDAVARNIENYVQNGGTFLSFLTFTHSNENVDDLLNPYAWTKSFDSLFGVHVATPNESSLDIRADTVLHHIEFTHDTFWYPWNKKTYTYSAANETVSMLSKFKYTLGPSENTTVIAWVNGIQSYPNAFIIENRRGSGYTYVINTRNSNSLPNGALTDVVADFIYYLCAYYMRPQSYVPFPENEYWLSHGQADSVVYLNHDNSTINQTILYGIRPLEIGLTLGKEYIVYDWIKTEFFSIKKTPPMFSLNVTLQPTEGKLFLLLEKEDRPQLIYSDTYVTENSWNQSLEVLHVIANGNGRQRGSIQVYSGESKPYYFKVNGEEVLTWSFDATKSVLSADFLFPSETIELSIGFKPIAIDRVHVSDERADVGSTQTIGFHAVWASDGSNLKGARIDVNGTEYFTNDSGWISFNITHNDVGTVFWNVNEVKYDTLTDYVQSVNDPYIIWDRINITDSILIDGIVQAGSSQPVWLTAEYEYDSARFDGSKGTIFLNGESMVWSDQNSRWETNVTSNTLGPQTYDVTFVDDKNFSLTTVRNQDTKISIIWEKVEISKVEFETLTLEVTNVRVYVTYDYTENPVINADVSVNGEKCSEIEPGIYTGELTYWGPFQSFVVEVKSSNFEQVIENVLSIHVVNTLMYLAIGLAIVLPVLFLVLRKKRNRQRLE
jgi:hypothetical protein